MAPRRAIAPAVAKKLYGVVMTSSPGPMFSAIRQASRASLPEETPIACEHPEYAAIAFSHCSTLGPSMKCWDSNTSASAFSISAFMAAYCALRSSSGTFIVGFFFPFPVRLGAGAQFLRQRSFFVQVKTAKDAFQFFIAIAAFRAPHDSMQVGGIQA